MSVAFRRESDEEHLEPKFERPIPPGPNLVTRRGLALIGATIAELEGALAAAENDETRAPIQRDLRYWRTRRATAEIAPPPAADVVGIGSRVTYRLAGKDQVAIITGTDEADPVGGRIGFLSPLARALIGAEPGERVDFNGRAEAIEVVATETAAEE